MKKIILFLKKYCYITIPIISIICLEILNYFNILIINLKANFSETIISISGTLIGFLFTAMTIFFSLNKDSEYMQYLKMFNHHLIFSKLVIIGIAALVINIIIWLFDFNMKLLIITFIIGLEETVMSAYYIYIISLNSFK